MPQVERGQTIGLDSRLVWELLEAGLRCPVFNDRQKFVLNIAAKNYRVAASPTARFWPFDTLTRKPNATEEHVMVWKSPKLNLFAYANAVSHSNMLN